MDDRGRETPPEAREFHYHYSARGPKSEGGRRMLDATGKVFLGGAIAMGGMFLGGFLLIGLLILGSFALFLGGGTLFCLAAAGYLLVSGVGLLAESAFTGLGVCGLGLILIAVTLLFAFATHYWVKRVVPGAHGLYQKFRGMFGDKEEAK